MAPELFPTPSTTSLSPCSGIHSRRRRQNSLVLWPFAYRGSSLALGTPRSRSRRLRCRDARPKAQWLQVLLSAQVLLDVEVDGARQNAQLRVQLWDHHPKSALFLSGADSGINEPMCSIVLYLRVVGRCTLTSSWFRLGVHYARDRDGEGKPRSDTRHTRHSVKQATAPGMLVDSVGGIERQFCSKTMHHGTNTSSRMGGARGRWPNAGEGKGGP